MKLVPLHHGFGSRWRCRRRKDEYISRHGPTDAAGDVDSISFAGERRRIVDLPYGVLVGVFLKWNNMKATTQCAIAKEIRRRPEFDLNRNGFLLARLNQLDPPLCHCGRIGIFIVGSTTYCRAHKDEAYAHLSVTGCRYHEAAQSEYEAAHRDDERLGKLRDAAMRMGARRRPKS